MQVSAGIFPTGERNTANVPTMKQATPVAARICHPAPDSSMRRNLTECPTAAINAQYRNARRGGRLIAENPIAAKAAKSASCNISIIILSLYFNFYRLFSSCYPIFLEFLSTCAGIQPSSTGIASYISMNQDHFLPLQNIGMCINIIPATSPIERQSVSTIASRKRAKAQI